MIRVARHTRLEQLISLHHRDLHNKIDEIAAEVGTDAETVFRAMEYLEQNHADLADVDSQDTRNMRSQVRRSFETQRRGYVAPGDTEKESADNG